MNAPQFFPSLISSFKTSNDLNAWGKAVHAAKNGQYTEAAYQFLDFIDPGLRTSACRIDDHHFSFPHGSVLVNLHLGADALEATIPFLTLPAGEGRIPLLRQLAAINFSPLKLGRIELEGEQLHFRYECPYDRFDLHKIYSSIEEIGLYADLFDDDFIHKFGATRSIEAPVQAWPEEVQQYIHETLLQMSEECIRYLEAFKEGFQARSWDLLAVLIRRIEYFAAPQGFYRNEMERCITSLDGSESPEDRLLYGGKFIAYTSQLSLEDVRRDFYQIRTFIPYKKRMDLQTCRTLLEPGLHRMRMEYTRNDHMAATFTALFEFYGLYYSNQVEDALHQFLARAMHEASSKPWHEASEVLFTAYDKLIDTPLGELETELAALWNINL